MTEIEKMYENAGIETNCCKYAEYGYEGEEGTWFYCTKENKECWTYPNGDANCVEKSYPPFTAEKQIELIKWLSKRRLLNITFCENKNTYQLSNNKCTGSFCSDLATAVATLVQCELDFCTEKEKEEIRGILNER